MSDLTQMVYISRATFPVTTDAYGINPNIAKILAKSRVKNREAGLVGVLYFADDCFLQCLEGPDEKLDVLMAVLGQDDRHRDIKVVRRNSIEKRSFEVCAMKYVAVERQVMRLLGKHGVDRFDPYVLSTPVLEEMLKLLTRAAD